MTRYCINCKNVDHPCQCAHCDGGDNYRQSDDSKRFEKEVRQDERNKLREEMDKVRRKYMQSQGYIDSRGRRK